MPKTFYSMCVMGLAVLLAPAVYAQGANQVPIVVASAQPMKRFISLQSVRAGLPSSPVRAMRSDTQAMRSGFMRLDRGMMVVNARLPRSNVVVTRPLATEAKPVADVFTPSARVSGHAWPVAKQASQYISSGYGMRADPFHGQQRFHGGIDIAVASGTPVLASADGVVSAVGTKGGFGNHVSITHADGAISMYGHLSGETVRVGQRVRQGQQVGIVGSTGRSTGAHLDFRLKKNGQTIDPMRVLAKSSIPVMSRGFASAAKPSRVAQLDAVGARRLPQRPMVIQVQ